MRSLVKGIEPNIAPIVTEVANLNALLRTRMDFVADIATAQKPPPALGISFVGEVLIPFIKSILFWDNLCASHGLKYEHIKFRFKVDNERDSITINAGQVPELAGKPEPLTMATVGFPNGIIGCQAFYCIIENFLRNAVKHSPARQQNLELTIWLQQDGQWEDNEHLMKVVIYDNWRACRHNRGLVDDINKRLRERIIRDDGSLIASNRGLKEMKAAAAYLRGYAPEAVEDSTIKPPLLTAVSVEDNLGYEFFVLRPKELLIAAVANKIPRDKYDLLRKQGVEIVSDASTLLVRARNYPLLLVMSNDSGIWRALEDPNSVSDLPLRIIIHIDSEIVVRSGLWYQKLSYSIVKRTFDELLESLKWGQGMVAVARAWELWTTIAYKDCTPKLWVYEDKGLTQWNINGTSRLVQGNAEPDQGTQVVLYARHGYCNRLHNAVRFYEPYGKGVDPISFVMENPPQQEEVRRGLAYQLIDAGLTPILILDERVQEMAYSVRRAFSEDPEGEKELAFWLRLMRIYVPSKGDLDLESKQLTQESIVNWVTQKVHELSGDDFLRVPPVLVIHQGILDVIGLQDSNRSQGWIDGLRSSANGVCDVVITSGRGVPDNVPPRARFLPLSALLLYTVERKSKFHLVRNLFTARRVK
jgi:hypothetical protein